MQADIAIRFSTPPDEANVVRRRVGTVGTGLYASKDYLERHPIPRTPADLFGHDVVRAGPEMSQLPMETFMEQHCDPGRIALRVNSMLIRLAAVRAGLGVGLLACFVADHDPLLRRIPMDLPELGASIWLGMHEDVRRAARVRAFADHIVASFEKQQGRLLGQPSQV